MKKIDERIDNYLLEADLPRIKMASLNMASELAAMSKKIDGYQGSLKAIISDLRAFNGPESDALRELDEVSFKLKMLEKVFKKIAMR